jgi:hypothetical protein
MATDWMGGSELARLALEAWRDAAHRVIDAQTAALLAVLDVRTGGRSPVEQWTEAQRELWRSGLALVGGDERRGAGRPGPVGPQAAGDTIDALRRAAEHLVQSQADWARAWTDADGRDGA